MAETQMIPFNSDCCGWGDAVPVNIAEEVAARLK